MSYTVVLTYDSPLGGARKVRVFGPYGSAENAEKARRRIHFSASSRDEYPVPRTYIAPIDKEREL